MVIISSRLGRDGNFREGVVGVFNCIPHNLLLPKILEVIKLWQNINFEELIDSIEIVTILFCVLL